MWPFKKTSDDFTELKSELLLLSREWFEGQLVDLPADELPPPEELEQDILDMRDQTFSRITSHASQKQLVLNTKDPRDEENRTELARLLTRYEGYEATTPIFTKLALSKSSLPRYQSGWPLCAIRLIAETYLEQSVA